MFLKNRNISSKIKRSKVTDYAALKDCFENVNISAIHVLLDFSLTVKAKPHECVIRTSQRFWVQMRYLVEIEILIFSDTYTYLEYTCEISVRYLKRFLRNRQ